MGEETKKNCYGQDKVSLHKVDDSLAFVIQDAERFRIHKNNQIPRRNCQLGMRKECEKLFMKKRPKPLPLPTLKLSEPPGAVRPDGIQPLLSIACHRTVTSKLINLKSNRIDVSEWVFRQALDKLAMNDTRSYISWQTKNKLSP